LGPAGYQVGGHGLPCEFFQVVSIQLWPFDFIDKLGWDQSSDLLNLGSIHLRAKLVRIFECNAEPAVAKSYTFASLDDLSSAPAANFDVASNRNRGSAGRALVRTI
jgi:hypothetical protein